jgi:S-(hydroxymethyl)glutathione dehydrogenase / alcohol dehydrogenase
MEAVVYQGRKNISLQTVPDPVIQHEMDVILGLSCAGISSDDVLIYEGILPSHKNHLMGQEVVGVIEEVGQGIRHLKKGDRVLVLYPLVCGECWFCQRSIWAKCESPPRSLALGQAPLCRVPAAGVNTRKIPWTLSDDEGIFLTHTLPVVWGALRQVGFAPGMSVAVFGCGAQGIVAQKVAKHLGASVVIGVDPVDYRLEMAKKYAHSQVINPLEVDTVEAIRQMALGPGADIVIDAAGMSSLTHRGPLRALRNCLESARCGGALIITATYLNSLSHFPLGLITSKGLSVLAQTTPMREDLEPLIEWAQAQKLNLKELITHEFPLSEAAGAYGILSGKKDNCLKVILRA